MEEALQQLGWALRDLLVPATMAGLVGIAKWARPRLKARLQGLGILYPLVALVLTRLTIKGCYAIGAPCEGNFLNWNDEETYAAIQFIAIVGLRELTVALRRVGPATAEWVAHRLEQAPPAAG